MLSRILRKNPPPMTGQLLKDNQISDDEAHLVLERFVGQTLVPDIVTVTEQADGGLAEPQSAESARVYLGGEAYSLHREEQLDGKFGIGKPERESRWTLESEAEHKGRPRTTVELAVKSAGRKFPDHVLTNTEFELSYRDEESRTSLSVGYEFSKIGSPLSSNLLLMTDRAVVDTFEAPEFLKAATAAMETLEECAFEEGKLKDVLPKLEL